MDSTIYAFGLIALVIHIIQCAECGKIAKRKEIKYSEAFLVNFLGTPVIGFPYIIAQQLPALAIEVNDQEELRSNLFRLI